MKADLPTKFSASEAPVEVPVLGTPLLITDYQNLLDALPSWAERPGPTAVEFCNTQVVTMRCIDPAFAEATRTYDHFVPDGMPLIWCLKAMKVPMPDRVYGPAFMRFALCHEKKLRHYFLGGTEETSRQLVEHAKLLGEGTFHVAAANYHYSHPADSAAILEEINRLSPDVIWVGFGTPKQQQWIHTNKHLIHRGVVLGVGFAFDVNAGTKRDAPHWMQRNGLTWLFRISQEPSRLLGRYLKYNTWFILLIGFELVKFYSRMIGQRFRSLFS